MRRREVAFPAISRWRVSRAERCASGERTGSGAAPDIRDADWIRLIWLHAGMLGGGVPHDIVRTERRRRRACLAEVHDRIADSA